MMLTPLAWAVTSIVNLTTFLRWNGKNESQEEVGRDPVQAEPSQWVRRLFSITFHSALYCFPACKLNGKTFMMQMRAAVINLSCSLLLNSPDAKRCSLSLSPSFSFSLTHWRSPSIPLARFFPAAALCYTRPQATWKMNQAQVMRWGSVKVRVRQVGEGWMRARDPRK